jgi:hypothetical protein
MEKSTHIGDPVVTETNKRAGYTGNVEYAETRQPE